MAVVITMSDAVESSKKIQKGVAALAESLNSVVQAVIHDRPKEVIVNKKEEPSVDKGPGLRK